MISKEMINAELEELVTKDQLTTVFNKNHHILFLIPYVFPQTVGQVTTFQILS